MGAEVIMDYNEGTDLDATFRKAVESSRDQCGDETIYTEAIAEKDKVVVLEATPLPYGDAVALAHRLIADGDPRIDDKWGPVGAIAVQGGEQMGNVEFETSRSLAREEDRAVYANELAAQRFPGADLTRAYWLGVTRENGVTRGKVALIVRGGPDHTGWLFVGWAPS
ncbi:hypothetical protein [Nocardia wallacei]|uniref:hypothetical protein n=1 Tax=Nocardia wallacei TaxID=480035 RepID=UPI002454A051|nr:hypothetical protein [Nocardia wallacei]